MKWFKIAIAGVLAAAAFLIYFGIPANFVVGAVKSRIEAQTGYRLRLGGQTTLSFWPAPTISLRDITLSTGDDSGADNRFKAERVSIALSLRDLWRGHTRITQLTISRPTLRLPLPRERVVPAPAVAPAATNSGPNPEALAVDHIAVEQGTIVFYGRSGGDEGQIDRVNLEISHATPGADVTGSLYVGSQLFNVDVNSRALPQRFEQQAIPIQVTLQAPGLFETPLSLSAELRSRNSAMAINTLSGRIGQNNFDGWASVDFAASKPQVKANIEFNRLQLLAPPPHDGGAQHPTALSASWSDRQYNFDALNFFDAQMRLSVADFAVASFHLAPVSVDATINAGVLQAKLANTALYGGTADGTIVLDASGTTPAQTLKVRLNGVSALPLLTDVADFDSLEGAMAADIDVHAAGASEQAAVSSLTGAVQVHLSNGAVRGIDLAKIMQDLTNTILNGWQWNANDRTPLTDLSANFSLANGVATTDNLALTGPVVRMTGSGTIDISAKTLQMKVDPRLIVAQQGASGSDSSAGSAGSAGSGQGTGLGVPVLIQGSWSAPRIFPDVAGILNDPSAIFNQLQAAGKGLFGGAGKSGDNGASGGANGANNTFDNLIGNFLNGSGGGGGGFLGKGR